MGIPDKLNEAINLWESTGKNVHEISNELYRQAQVDFINAVRPSKMKILDWKTSESAISKVVAHIFLKTGLIVTFEAANILWRIWSDNKVVRRNMDNIKNEFFEIVNICPHCNRVVEVCDLHLDHIIPLALGGDNSQNNMQLLCCRCNLSKGAKPDKIIPILKFL